MKIRRNGEFYEKKKQSNNRISCNGSFSNMFSSCYDADSVGIHMLRIQQNVLHVMEVVFALVIQWIM